MAAEHPLEGLQAVADRVIVEIDECDPGDLDRQGGGEGEHGFGRIPQETGQGRVSDRPAAGAAPPVALRVGRHERPEAPGEVVVEPLDGEVVGVSVGGLHLVQVEAGREEQHRLAVGRDQGLVDVGRHA